MRCKNENGACKERSQERGSKNPKRYESILHPIRDFVEITFVYHKQDTRSRVACGIEEPDES